MIQFPIKLLLGFFLLQLIGDYPVMANISNKDLTLTLKEKKILDQFTERITNSLTQDYMKTDIYLIKWLRAAGLDLSKAETMLKKHLQWRADNRVDSILDENFENFEQDYPINVEGVDLNGSPVITINVEDWDIRKGVLSGQTELLQRYITNRLETVVSKVRKAQAEGQNVTRFQFFDNLKGFNLIQHACLQCMPLQINLLSDFQNQYPGMVDNIVYVNAPASVEVPLRVLRPILNQELRDSLKIFGTDKKEWQAFLYKIISPDQLDRSFK